MEIKLSKVNCASFANPVGIGLVNKLGPKLRIVKFVMFASPTGIGPIN